MPPVAHAELQAATSHHYIGNNQTQSTGCRVGTCGEQILFESAGTHYTGSPTSVASTTLTFSGTPFVASRFVWDDFTSWQDPKVVNPAVVYIQRGPGAGQYRRITANTTSQLTVDRPWDVPPDTKSVVSIGNASFRSAVYLNTLAGFAEVFTQPDDLYNAGVITLGTVMDLEIDKNTISTTTTGVQLSTLVNNSCVAGSGGSNTTNGCPNWNITAKNNTITDVKFGLTSWSRIENPDRTSDLLVNLNKISDNTVSTARSHALSVGDINQYGVDRIWQRSAIVEYNQVTNAQRYLFLLGLQTGTVVRNNTFSDTDLYSGTIGIDFSSFSHEPHLYSNGYDSDIDKRYSGSLPGARVKVLERRHRFTATGPTGDSRPFLVRNVGTSPLNLSVSDDAAWLTTSLNTTRISDESGNAELTVNVNPAGLLVGNYSGIVTVTGQAVGIDYALKQLFGMLLFAALIR